MPCNKSKLMRSGERSQVDGTLLQLDRSTHRLVVVRMSTGGSSMQETSAKDACGKQWRDGAGSWLS
jgi:hypothetical protein